MNQTDAARAKKLLEGQGYFIDADIDYSISRDGAEKEVKKALRAEGYEGEVIISADENGGEWTYYAYDPRLIEPSKAKSAAVSDALSRS